ncbi:sensor histidine kinase [Calidifontibacillus oryziterrae]|uniref:sensor histidine kinase n=1 Tax=Calidifontibacillus oryziterrae TaxID=1191699 RepID=UPI0002DA6808|nr:HAMP domain-containing sensor histidine kinase [Calidifontibacillus oryziterrae]
MKLRTWLAISYFIVMVLPLLSAYCFYIWLQSTNNQQLFHDYLDANTTIAKLEKKLQNPSLYSNSNQYIDELNTLTTDYESIRLFNAEGVPLFSSHQNAYFSSKLAKEELYQDLYKLRSGLRAHTIKKPVFLNGTIIGFYEIEITRVDNIQKMNEKRNLITFLFFLSFIAIYTFIILLVKRKLTIPLTQLMRQMTDFAAGKSVAEIRAGKDEIGVLIQHFEKMRKLLTLTQTKVQQEQKGKEFIIASISHDLKTPLTSMRAYSESLKQTNITDGERNEYIDVIIGKADYMKQMLDDLTIYTLLQSDEKKMERVVVDAEEYFEMLLSGYEKLCDEKQIILTQQISVTGTIFVNSKEMVRVIDNLVTNAIKFTRANERIWLGAFSEIDSLPQWIFPVARQSIMKYREHGFIVVVQNEGQVIPEKDQPKVFQPLYQVEEARTKSDTGTGLGLSIAKIIIEKHEGMIELYSEADHGTTIVCWLPFYKK